MKLSKKLHRVVETRYGVQITKKDGIKRLALGGSGSPYALYPLKKFADEFRTELKNHISSDLKTVKVEAHFYWNE